jgi:hypothetical protein
MSWLFSERAGKDRAVRRSLSIQPAHPAPAFLSLWPPAPTKGPAARGSVYERPGRDLGDPIGSLVEIAIVVRDETRQGERAIAAVLTEALEADEQVSAVSTNGTDLRL